MAGHQELVRLLLSAGHAPHPDKNGGTFILSIDDDSLVSELFSGDISSEQELVASPVRPKSTAAYLVASNDRVVIYVSPDSTLHATRYDEDEDEWVEIQDVPDHKVHPNGKLAATPLPPAGENLGISYQDPTGKLVFLEDLFSPRAFTLPANAIVGTPLFISAGEDELRIYYVSSDDNCIHYVVHSDGGWVDKMLAQCPLEGTPKQFIVGTEDNATFTAYVLTAGDTLVMVAQESNEPSKLGTVDSKGKYTPVTSAECGWIVPSWCFFPRRVVVKERIVVKRVIVKKYYY